MGMMIVFLDLKKAHCLPIGHSALLRRCKVHEVSLLDGILTSSNPQNVDDISDDLASGEVFTPTLTT
jgi:hypothetical protein